MVLASYTNNPLNIRYSEYNKWRGQKGQYKGFCRFTNDKYGYRAAFILLRNYIRKGYNTIDKIIYRFAPPSENDTYSYVRFINDKMLSECPTLEKSSIIPKIETIEQLIYLVHFMALFESGDNPTLWYLKTIVERFKITM